ncbi:MAG: HEAT repeat domain-containing protein [Methanobacteriaceae archaeon]|jgi:HEAT repeat protein|nr:HEAT repeat domain-containing protein [Candidatus Methanorudis spinitermitis]
MKKDIQDLIEDLKDDDEFVVEEARGTLEIRADESFEYLVEALTGTHKKIKMNSAKVLGFIANEKAIDPLIATLKDKNKLVRREASTALSRMGNKVIDPMLNILNDDDWRVRGAAAWVLGSIGDKKAIEPLKNLLEDESGFVKSGAKWAIDKINKKN